MNSTSYNPFGKALATVLLCIVFLVLLRPERLINALQDTLGQENTQTATAWLQNTYASLGLTSFSAWQHTIITAGTTPATVGTVVAETTEQEEQGPTEHAPLVLHNATAKNTTPNQLTIQPQHNATVLPEFEFVAPPEFYVFALSTNGTKTNNTSLMLPIPEEDLGAWHSRTRPLWKGAILPVDEETLQNAMLYNYFPTPQSVPHRPLIMLTGDSMMMEGLGPALLRTLRKRTDVEVRREAVYSTGLCRQDYFDWPAHMTKLVEEYSPAVVVICIGGNDAQDIVDANKKRHFVGTQSWQEQYKLRAEELAKAAQAKGAALIWVGMPILGKEPQATNTVLLTAQQKAVTLTGTNRFFVDTYSVLTDSKGAYTTFMKDAAGAQVRVRSKDQVHVSEAGGKLLEVNVLPVIDNALLAVAAPALAKDAKTSNKSAASNASFTQNATTSGAPAQTTTALGTFAGQQNSTGAAPKIIVPPQTNKTIAPQKVQRTLPPAVKTIPSDSKKLSSPSKRPQPKKRPHTN